MAIAERSGKSSLEQIMKAVGASHKGLASTLQQGRSQDPILQRRRDLVLCLLFSSGGYAWRDNLQVEKIFNSSLGEMKKARERLESDEAFRAEFKKLQEELGGIKPRDSSLSPKTPAPAPSETSARPEPVRRPPVRPVKVIGIIPPDATRSLERADSAEEFYRRLQEAGRRFLK